MSLIVRPADIHEDAIIAEYFRLMWRDYDLEKKMVASWQNIVLEFIREAREKWQYRAFLAELAGEVIGSAACQRFQGLYPNVFDLEKRNYGYIWGVYIVPEQRGKGAAKLLTTACTDYLKESGCTRAILHAAPMGRPVYEKLGFKTGNEMYLDLVS